MDLINYWVSWYDENYGEWEYHGPWWVSGENDHQKTICMAVQAESALAAVATVYGAHDNPHEVEIEFRFIEERPDDWNPLDIKGGRFPARDWMVWPMTNEENLKRKSPPQGISE